MGFVSWEWLIHMRRLVVHFGIGVVRFLSLISNRFGNFQIGPTLAKASQMNTWEKAHRTDYPVAAAVPPHVVTQDLFFSSLLIESKKNFGTCALQSKFNIKVVWNNFVACP